MLRKILPPVLLLILTFLPGSASAKEDLRALIKTLSDRLGELNDQVKQSNQRISDLEAELAQAKAAKIGQNPPIAAVQPTAPAAPGPTASAKAEPSPGAANPIPTGNIQAVTVGDTKGSFKIPGTDTSLGFGGYVKLDANYSSTGMGGDKLGDQHLVAAQIPVGLNKLDEHSKTSFHAKESRFWLKSFTPSKLGNIETFLELDFLGAPDIGTYTPRLRHAYGSIGNFLAGQTWTTFLNVSAIPDTLDPAGPVGGLVYLRQPLVRWTQPFQIAGTPMEWQTAAETPKSRLWTDPGFGNALDAYNFTNPNNDRYPDLVTRFNVKPDWGTLSLSAMARQIRYAKQATTVQQGDWGAAVSLAGRIDIQGLDNLRFMLNYGNGLGRYATFNTFEDAAMNAGGRMQLVNVYSGVLAYQHWWDKFWRSTLAYGFAKAEQPIFVTGEMTRQTQSVSANLLWSPYSQTTFGLEYIYAQRERVDGLSGDLHRIQFSTRFNF